MPAIAPDFETAMQLNALASRAHAVDKGHGGMGTHASTVRHWRHLLEIHHTRIAPLDFAALASLGDPRFFVEACAIRRRWTHHSIATAIDGAAAA
ncbi:MAG: hypothetical protein ACOYLS_01445 [Polymorphobacter sp.]